MADGRWTDAVIDALQSAESAQRKVKELEDQLKRVKAETWEEAASLIERQDFRSPLAKKIGANPDWHRKIFPALAAILRAHSRPLLNDINRKPTPEGK